MFKFLKTVKKAYSNPEILEKAIERSNETRALNKEIRELKHKKELLKKEMELEELRQELEELKAQRMASMIQEDEGSMEDKLLNLLMIKMLAGNSQRNSLSELPSSIPTPQQPEGVSLSDEELNRVISQLPKKVLKIAKNLPDNAIRSYITKNFNWSEETIQRAIAKVKNV